MNITSHSIHCAALRAFGSALVAAITAAVLPTPAFAQLPICAQAPGPGCLYFPAASHGFTAFERSAFYTDHANQQREVRFLIRQPIGAPAPMPVVVWSHGGADGKQSPTTSMVEWSGLLPPAQDWSFTPRRTFQPRRR